MGGAGDRVFRDTDLWAEKARDEVLLVAIRARGNDETPFPKRRNRGKIWREVAHFGLGREFDEPIKSGATIPARVRKQGVQGGIIDRGGLDRREVERDRFARSIARQDPAARVKGDWSTRTSGRPQRVCRSKRRMAAKIDFGKRGEPSQGPTAVDWTHVSRLRLVHLHREVLHPVLIDFLLEYDDGRRITGEWRRSERVDEIERTTHPTRLAPPHLAFEDFFGMNEDHFGEFVPQMINVR